MPVSTITMKTQKSQVQRISVPPRLAAGHLQASMEEIDGASDEIHLLASGVKFADPLDICALRTLIDHAAEMSGRVYLECPGDSSVNRYLERMNLYDGLPDNVELSSPRPAIRRQPLGGKLIELSRIVCSADVEALMDRTAEIAGEQFGRRSTVTVAFATAVGAAAENVVMHAKSPTGALVAAQRYQRTGLELAVVDRGLGIPRTLSANPRHQGLSDLQAVERSLQDKVSSSLEEGRGAGLWELCDAVAASRNATLAIASGRADLSLSWADGALHRNPSTPAKPISGTWIAIRLEPGKEKQK
jgi:anti-sigma regulatory factor (Ser/Thr protein kinase)